MTKVKPSALRTPQRPTILDVARHAGVSKMTVSRAILGQSVAPATRDHVLAVVEALGYVPNAAAGTLSSRRSGFVAAIVPMINNSNFADTAHGLTEALKEPGLQLLLGFSEYDAFQEERLVRAMLARQPEAVVLTGSDHTRATLAMLSKAALPVLETWELPETPIGCAVGFSNAEAGRMMVRYLAGRGYRHIGFIGPSGAGDGRAVQREEGYRSALLELGLDPARVIRHGTPPLSMEDGDEALALAVERYPELEAVFCASDLTAFGVIMACHRRGWQVPGRLAVAGFGDFEVGRACFPAITTVAVDSAFIGRRTGEILLEALTARRTGQAWPANKQVQVPLRLMPRGSA